MQKHSKKKNTKYLYICKTSISAPHHNQALVTATVANSILWPCPSAVRLSVQGQGQASDGCILSFQYDSYSGEFLKHGKGVLTLGGLTE